MSDDVKPGDAVEWTSSGGRSVGKVKKKLTAPMEIKGHHVAATPENPEFLVESEKSGAQAAHKPGSLKKTSADAAPAKKASAKKAPAKSAPAKKAGAKKAPAKKTPAKKTAAKKAAR